MGTAKAIANVRSLKRKTILFDLKITIIYATLAYVSAAVKTNTLQLNGSAVYGHSFDLVCFTEVNVDVPYATFIRRISLSQEGSGIATILYYSSINSCYLTPTSYKNYTYRCNNEGKNITLTVPAENEVEHNTFWVCANQGSENEENNNVINVFVNDPVRNVSIVNNTVVIVTEGISVTFACETSPCRPSADIYWMKNGINITDPQANNSIHQSGTKNITLSSLRFSLSRRDNGSLLSCGAYNGYGTRTLSANVTSIVYYSPDDSPSIYGYSNTSVVKVIEKMSYTLICSITGGNPLASLSWICFGIVGSNDIVAQRVNSTINLNVQRNRTGQHCQCISSQEIQGSRTVLIAVEVLYSPTVNPFKSPLKVIQGQPLVVVCNADGNPTPQMTWNPAGEDSRNKSRLVYSAISRENAVIHRCAAKNDMVPTTGNPQQGSDAEEILIDVLYAPSVNPFTSPVNVIQGKPLVVECSADGNPSPQLKWNPAGEDSMNKSRLYYSAISRDKAVIHTCTARNDMVPTTGSSKPGSDSKELVIEVLYSPTVNPFTSPVKVIQGQPLVVVCSADGNPTPQMTWNPAGEDSMNGSRLYYSAISGSNAVIHICAATNNMVPTTGNPQQGSDSEELLIDVLYSPIVNPFTLSVEVIEGQPLVVVCSADGNPSPQITWNPAGEDKLNRSRLYYSAISRDKVVSHTCTASNNMVPTTGNPQPGSDIKELVIDVLYNASVYMFTSKDNISVLNEHSSLQLLCQVDSNPNSVISLYFENDLKLQVKNSLNLSYTNTVACHDAGKYKCTARNKIMNKDAVSRDLQINVTCYPRLDDRRNVSTEYYAGLGDIVTLEVYLIAYPEPTNTKWYHREKETDMWQIFPYQSPSSSGLYSSIMVHLDSERDFGYYWVNMSNDFGIYNDTYRIIPEKLQSTSFPVAAVAGSISGALVAGVCIMVVLIFLRRRGQRSKREDDDLSTELREKERPESGLVDNPVYDSSDPKASPSTSTGAAGTEYAVVVKKKAVLIENSSTTYAQVLKQKQKKKKGDIYENADIVGRSPSRENKYANSNNVMTKRSDDNVYENPGAAASYGPMINEDGLLYADLMLDHPITMNGKPVIRGIENRTEYAEISYGKRGKPLPDSDEENENKPSGANNYTDE